MPTSAYPACVQSKESIRFTTLYSRIQTTGALAVLLLLQFLQMSGFARPVAHWAAKVFPQSLLISDAIVFLVIFAVASVPRQVAALLLFALLRRYQLTLLTKSQWLAQALKKAGGTVLAGVVLTCLTYLAIRMSPRFWWIGAATLFSSAWLLVLQFYPMLHLRLLGKITVLEGELSERLIALAARADVRISNVWQLQISDRYSLANAAVTGIGKRRRIILTDTLLHSCTEDEVEALFAHEIGHCVHHDLRNRFVIRVAGQYVVFFLIWLVLPTLAGDLADISNLTALLSAYFVFTIYLSIFEAPRARKQEFRADQFAFGQISDVDAFISGLQKIARKNLLDVNEKNQSGFSHPATAARIAAAREYAVARLTQAPPL